MLVPENPKYSPYPRSGVRFQCRRRLHHRCGSGTQAEILLIMENMAQYISIALLAVFILFGPVYTFMTV